MQSRVMYLVANEFRFFWDPANTRKKRVLSEQLRKQFYKKELVSFEFNNLSPEQEEDLFARVQMGMQLNMAEKMRASTGPWQELARKFVDDFPTVYSLMKDRARSKDFQITLSCFSQIVECMHPTNANGIPILKTNHTHLPKLLNNKSAVDDGLRSHLASVWQTFRDLIEADSDTFTNSNKYLRGVQTFAPVEMVAVAVLISTHLDTRNNRLLIGDIQAMRTAVRENFVDLRLNSTVWKWFWEYIDELEGIRGAIEGSTVIRRTEQRTKKTTTLSTAGLAMGPTAASITAAAAAPKRGRATARTNRSAVALAEETSVAVKQEPATIAIFDIRSSKRQRTGDSPRDETLTNGDQFEMTTRNDTTDSAQASIDVPPEWTRVSSLSPSMSAFASTQNPQPRSRQRNGESSFPPETALLAPNATSPVNNMSSRFSRTPLATPFEARQQRVSELNSYQTPYQSAPGAIQPPILDGNAHIYPMRQSRVPTAPMLAGPAAYEVPARTVPGSFDAGQSQWGGIVAPVTPDTDIVPQVPDSRPRSTRATLTISPRPAQDQSSGLIDLTSDTEQERQSLLSRFKAKPANTEPRQMIAKATTLPPAQKRPSASKQNNAAEELTMESNPYAR